MQSRLADERLSLQETHLPCTAISVDAILHPNATTQHHLEILRLLGVFLARSLILVDKIIGGVSSEPVSQFRELFTEAVDGLVVHIGLSNQLGEGDCGG